MYLLPVAGGKALIGHKTDNDGTSSVAVAKYDVVPPKCFRADADALFSLVFNFVDRTNAHLLSGVRVGVRLPAAVNGIANRGVCFIQEVIIIGEFLVSGVTPVSTRIPSQKIRNSPTIS